MLKINNLDFSYSELDVLSNINFTVSKGEHVSIIGESGSGKSTLLKVIYGLLELKSGSLFWGKQKLLGPNYNLIPGEPFMKYVAQDFELMPFTTVAENISKYFVRGEKNGVARTAELISLVGLEAYADTKVKNLSGGQQQRVALARALATEPAVLLLDEPFNQIDHFLKNSLRRNLFAYLKKEQISCIVATHDMTDALSYSDTTLVLKEGAIVAKQPPRQLYEQPTNAYVALLFGEINALKVTDVWKGDIPAALKSKSFFCYPHDLRKSSVGTLAVTVKQSYYRGNRYLVQAVYKKQSVFFNHPSELAKGAKVSLFISKGTVKKRMPR
jgi:ABC-type sulfate/molybdate transport systems ATPase subunit